MPKMTEEELKSAVILEAENHIPLPIEEVYLDFQVIPPVKDHLDHYDILITALPKTVVNPYVSCIKKAGLKPLVFEMESFAIARTLIKDEVAPTPILIIDFGAVRTSFIVFSGYSLRFTFSIPVSSQSFTEAVSRTMKIDLNKAEKIKTKYGLETKATKEGGEVFDALVPPITDLVEQIKKCLNYYQSHTSHEHLSDDKIGIEKVLICGGGAGLKGLTALLSQQLGLRVEFGNPWINIPLNNKKETLKLSVEESLKYTTALGLARRGLREKKRD
jgi:type IV pilus assembly protein PilM